MNKVLIVASVISFIEWFEKDVISYLNNRKCEVHIACNLENMSDTSAERTKRFINESQIAGVVFHNVPFSRSPFSKDNINAYKAISKLINKYHFSFIHCHTPMASILTRLASKNTRKQGTIVIYTSHGFHFYKGAPLKNWILFFPFEKYCSRLTDVLITIGEVVSVDATCTSLRDVNKDSDYTWNSICAWGPTAMLPVFQILGTDYVDKHIVSRLSKDNPQMDEFTKIDFVYPYAVASVKVGKGVKSEGELIISGTKGYVYVPAPWWKTDYFEIRYENPADNKRYFYQLDGEGIQYELVSFVRSIHNKCSYSSISMEESKAISSIICQLENRDSIRLIK